MRIGLVVLSLLSLSVPAFAADVPESYYERQSEYREAPPPVEREVVVEERRPVVVEEEPVVVEEEYVRRRPRVVIEEDFGPRWRHHRHGYWHAGYGRW